MRSNVDMAVAVDMGFTMKTIDALRKEGCLRSGSGQSHHQASHSFAPPGEPEQPTVEESDCTAGVARAIAVAEKTLRQPGQGPSLASQAPECPGWANSRGVHPHRCRCPDRREAPGANLSGCARLMRMWRLSGADYAERFDGGFGHFHGGRWNTRECPHTNLDDKIV